MITSDLAVGTKVVVNETVDIFNVGGFIKGTIGTIVGLRFENDEVLYYVDFETYPTDYAYEGEYLQVFDEDAPAEVTVAMFDLA